MTNERADHIERIVNHKKVGAPLRRKIRIRIARRLNLMKGSRKPLRIPREKIKRMKLFFVWGYVSPCIGDKGTEIVVGHEWIESELQRQLVEAETVLAELIVKGEA